jgi:hypothetical protein
MSDFKFSCPACGQHLAAGDGDSGRQIACPSCQAPMVVPANPESSPPPIPTAARANELRQRFIPPPAPAASSSVGRRVAMVFGCIVVLVVGSFALWRGLLAHSVNSQFAKIRAAGYPVSGAEINAWRGTVPDNENGARAISRGLAMIRTFPDSRSNLIFQVKTGRTNQWNAATRGLVVSYLQLNAPALAAVREGLLLSRFRYPVDYSYDKATVLPYLSSLKQMGLITEMEADLEAEEGHADQWPETVALELKLARTIDDEPTLISHAVRSSIIRMSVSSAERNLNRAAPGDDACRKLQAAFTQAGATNLLPLVLAGERATTIPYFRMSLKDMQRTGQEDEPGSQPQPPQRMSGKPLFGLWLLGFFERDLNFYLKTMDKAISLAALPPPASFELTNDMDSAGYLARKRFYIFSSMMLPACSKVTVQEAQMLARERLALTAFAVERYRLAKGRLPDSLGDLKPQFLDAVPTDPFDGQPIRYRRLPRGYDIYSIGLNGHDDGGQEAPEIRPPGDKTPYAITFIVER